MGWGWLSQTRPIPRSPDGDKIIAKQLKTSENSREHRKTAENIGKQLRTSENI